MRQVLHDRLCGSCRRGAGPEAVGGGWRDSFQVDSGTHPSRPFGRLLPHDRRGSLSILVRILFAIHPPPPIVGVSFLARAGPSPGPSVPGTFREKSGRPPSISYRIRDADIDETDEISIASTALFFPTGTCRRDEPTSSGMCLHMDSLAVLEKRAGGQKDPEN
eukprot:scaffold110_cov315-Pavlova_lutheri.AAC.11